MKSREEERARARPVQQDHQVRALFVVNTLPPHDLSGAGEQVVQLAQGLRDQGVAVEILGRGRQGARGPKLLFPLTVVLPVLYRVGKGDIDVVQVHESDGGFVALLLRLFRLPGLRSLLPAVRLVALLQVSYDKEAEHVRPLMDADLGRLAIPVRSEIRFRRYRTPLQRLLGRCTVRCADVVLVPSIRTGEEVREDYGGPSPKVVPNATAAGALSLSEPSPKQGALLFVGRLRIRKGVEVLLWAMAKLRDRGLDVRLSIAGDGERRKTLEDLTEELQLGDRVQFLGRCNRADLDRLLLESTALVVPSTYEGMPLVILEAMNASVPVVASAVSGIPEVVVDGVTGWLVPPCDINALTATLASVLSDGEECRRRGVAGRTRLARYRPEVVAEAWRRAVVETRR